MLILGLPESLSVHLAPGEGGQAKCMLFCNRLGTGSGVTKSPGVGTK